MDASLQAVPGAELGSEGGRLSVFPRVEASAAQLIAGILIFDLCILSQTSNVEREYCGSRRALAKRHGGQKTSALDGDKAR